MLKVIANVSEMLYVALHGAFYIEEQLPRPKNVHEQFIFAMRAPSHAQDSKKQSIRRWPIHPHEDPEFVKFPLQVKTCDNKFILNILITLSQLVKTKTGKCKIERHPNTMET